MFCIHCGGPLPDGARFCPSCGKKVSGHPSSAPAQAAKSLFRTGVSRQAGYAALAAAMADSTSSFVQQGTFAISSPVEGL